MKHVQVVVMLSLTSLLSGHVAEQKRAPATRGKSLVVYVGTYTDKGSKGIYAYRFTPRNETLTPIGIAAESANPSFLAVHPSRRFLYAVNEISNYEGRREGSISAFAIDAKNGMLTLLNTVSSGGRGPVHLSVDHSGRWLVVANFGGGAVASFPINEDGRLSAASGFVKQAGSRANAQLQRDSRTHGAVLAPDDRFVFVPDLSQDKIFSYRLTLPAGGLTPNEPPFATVAPGSGPRHMAFHPDGKSVFVVNEVRSTITAFSYDGRAGRMTEQQTISTLPENFNGTSYASVVEVHPTGRFLYGSNRGLDTIAMFSIHERKRALSPPVLVSSEGRYPRHFAIDPTGSFLIAANQHSDNVVLFRIEPRTGRLTPTGTVVSVIAPACIAFLPVE